MVKSPRATLVMTTTTLVQGRPVGEYLGVVAAQSLIGANDMHNLLAGFRDFLGGRSKSHERTLQKAREEAMEAMETEAATLGADAVIGISLSFQTLGPQGSIMMVSASGTAVRFGDAPGSSMAVRKV
jgi:uncharacterized protein YbjQ (UPF0145 family)